MNPEKLQPNPRESEATDLSAEASAKAGALAKAETKPEEITAFEAFGKRGQRPPGGQEKKEPQIEAKKTISLAREAEEAFSRNDFDAALLKLRELQRAASPEKTPERKEGFAVLISNTMEKLLKEGADKSDVAWGLAGVGTPEAMEFRKKHFSGDPTLYTKSFNTGWTSIDGIICQYGYEK